MACFGARLSDDIELQHLTEDEYSTPPDEDMYKEIPAFPRKAKPSRDDTETFRFMVLGGDDPLMNEACETILGIRYTEYANVIRIRENIKTNVSRHKVSVLKTPFYWLHYLKSNLIFRNAVKSIKQDMKYCESLLFPGPHVFLLVLGDAQNSGKELLLQAVSDVFGKQALDYSMVLFTGECREKDIRKNRCVKKCRNRYHVLENTEKLLDYVETVIQTRENSYFTKHFELTERAKDHFQTEFGEQNLEHAELEKSLRSELRGMRKTVEDLRKENTQLKERMVDSKGSVNQFRFDDSEARKIQFRKEFDEYETRQNLFRKESGESKAIENQLRKELDESKATEIHFRKELDESKAIENQFRKELDDSKATEICLRKELDEYKCREFELNLDLKILQSEIEQLKATEKGLKRNLSETKAKEAFLLKQIQSECDIIQRNEELQAKETELCERQRELEFRERNLEFRERDLAQRNTWSGGSESQQYIRTTMLDQFRPHEGDGAESSDGDSHVAGSDVMEGLDFVRRNSLRFKPPNMSERKHEPSHNLRTNSGGGYIWRLYK